MLSVNDGLTWGHLKPAGQYVHHPWKYVHCGCGSHKRAWQDGRPSASECQQGRRGGRGGRDVSAERLFIVRDTAVS